MDKKRLTRTELMLEMACRRQNLETNTTTNPRHMAPVNTSIIEESVKHEIIIIHGETDNFNTPSVLSDSTIIEPDKRARPKILESVIDFQSEPKNFEEPSVLTTLTNVQTEFEIPNNVALVTEIDYKVLAEEGQSHNQDDILNYYEIDNEETHLVEAENANLDEDMLTNEIDFENQLIHFEEHSVLNTLRNEHREFEIPNVALGTEINYGVLAEAAQSKNQDNNILRNEEDNEEIHPVEALVESEEGSSDDEQPLSKIRNGLKRNVKKRKHTINRKERAKLKAKMKHPLRDPCKDKCKKGCNKLIDYNQRKSIHENYWLLSWNDQRKFILNSCSRMPVKRRTKPENSQRNMTFCYRLLQVSGKYVDVCKTFYLGTLGYHHKNDKVIFNVLHKSAAGSIIPNEDQRGKNPPPNKLDRQLILAHINSFNPSISHYRREHAPRVKYLPSDVTVTIMHNDFLEKFPQYKCGYKAYRKILFTENIRFTRLGNEECEHCEMMDLHPHKREDLNPECDTCKKWSDHINRAKTARHLYQKHAAIEYDSKTICVSADLEKIIMLPRMENFKKVLFTQRLVLYNETFVPLGTKNKKVLPVAVVWHEAIRGRGKEELISTFFQFTLHNRDAEHFIFWLDNCSAQNKNWAFMSFLVYIVNSSKIAAETILVNYFEPGHTFMSADSLHHQIELSLKHQKKTQDFNDFVQAVQKSNSGKVTAKVMNIDDFYDFKDYSSAHKRNTIENEKILLSNINQVKVCRGSFDLQVKSDLNSNEFKILNFLRGDIYKKKNIPDPASHSIPCGITEEKKEGIIKQLLGLMDDNRKEFWLNLPVTINAEIVKKTCNKRKSSK